LNITIPNVNLITLGAWWNLQHISCIKNLHHISKTHRW